MAGPVAVETGATYSEKQGTERLQDHLAAALILTLPHRKFALGRRRRDHRFPLGLLCCRCHSMQPTAYSACCGDGPRSASAHRRVIGVDQARKCADVVDAACAETGSARPCGSWYRHALSLRFFKRFRTTQRIQARGSFQPPGASLGSSISPLPGACIRRCPNAASAGPTARSTPTPRIETIQRVACSSPVKVGGEGAHVVLQLGEHTDVMHSALFIKGRDQFGARRCPAARPNGRNRHFTVDHSDRRFYHRAAIVAHHADRIVDRIPCAAETLTFIRPPGL